MNKATRGDAGTTGKQSAVSAAPLDPSKMQTERRSATHRLLSRLKALDGDAVAETPRAYAQRYIREQESVILGLLNAGVAAEEILADLALSFASIPATDLRHALTQLRDRRRKQDAAAASPQTGQSSQPSDAKVHVEARVNRLDSTDESEHRRPLPESSEQE